MAPSDISATILVTLVVLVLAFLWNMRKIKRVYITDYMRGVRYVKGSFRDVLGPGSYQPFTRRVTIERVDMRPVPFVLERIFYRDALQSDAVVSVGAQLLVSDPHVASTMSEDKVGDSIPIVRDTLRSVLSRGITDESPEFRVKAAEDITSAANAELSKFGMKISNVEVTELSSRSGFRNDTAGPN
jgi:regulator of protease activity HflC (stomatin/prohibitin superfamily)